jgi:hypothetical protein
MFDAENDAFVASVWSRTRGADSWVVRRCAGAAHHHPLFGRAWDEAFADVITRGRVMSDPSLLLTRPTAGDPTLAPPGRDLLYILAPVPNLVRGQINWDRFGPEYAEEMLGIVRGRLRIPLRDPRLLHITTPAGRARRGMLAGSPYDHARIGIALLAPRSRPCVTTALTLYSEILDRIESLDFDIFAHRARVGIPRRVAVGSRGLARALWARRPVPRIMRRAGPQPLPRLR